MATRRGTNLPRMGDFNQSVILEAIRQEAGGLSRTELAAFTGLSPQTVTNITRRLLDDGIITETGRSILGRGKPRTILGLVPQSRYAVGVHLDPAVVTVVLLDLSGAIVKRSAIRHGVHDEEGAVDVIGATIDALITAAAVDRSRVVGIGVAAPGPLDVHRSTLHDALAAATELPVIFEKDTVAAAIGELWTRPAPAGDSFVLLYLGTGLGVALSREGEVARGGRRSFGEIGHIVVDPDGPSCVCGARGCVVVTCTPAAILTQAQAAGVFDDDVVVEAGGDEALDRRFTQLCERAAAADPVALGVLRQAAARTSVLLSVLVDLLDVDRIVLGGPFWSRLADVYLRELPDLVGRRRGDLSEQSIPIDGTVVGDDVGAVGAACVVLDTALTPRASLLLLG